MAGPWLFIVLFCAFAPADSSHVLCSVEAPQLTLRVRAEYGNVAGYMQEEPRSDPHVSQTWFVNSLLIQTLVNVRGFPEAPASPIGLTIARSISAHAVLESRLEFGQHDQRRSSSGQLDRVIQPAMRRVCVAIAILISPPRLVPAYAH